MKELDLLLSRYLEERFAAASEAHRRAFEALLEAPDPLIQAYCLGRLKAPNGVLSSLIADIIRGSGAS
jgi:succinate dehydrogenase flavin-adding protein (antitoxin of CptAB toxin-antitoxin module)